MKKHPFLESSFIVRLQSAGWVLSALQATGGGPAPIVDVKAERVFVIQSRTAHKIVRELVSDPQGRERLAYGTGYRFANILTLDHFILIETANSSRVHVDPDAESRLRALEELDRYGLAVNNLSHNHPGTGAESVNPSHTDIETQRHLEARYGAIGAICNAGGYLQFFSTSQFFQLVIVGKGIEDHGIRHEAPGFRHLLRLTEFDQDSVQAERLAGASHGQARAGSLVQPGFFECLKVRDFWAGRRLARRRDAREERDRRLRPLGL